MSSPGSGLFDPRRLALANGLARSALGVVALLAPALPLKPWIGDEAGQPAARLLARALGGRDLAIGLGTVMAARHDGVLRGWVEAGALADAGDVVVTLAAFRRLPRLGRWLVLAAAAGGAASAALTSRRVDAPAPDPTDG